MSASEIRAERIGPTVGGLVALEDRHQPGQAAFDQLLDHDVGVVDPGLRQRRTTLSIFTASGGPLDLLAVACGSPVSGQIGGAAAAWFDVATAAVGG